MTNERACANDHPRSNETIYLNLLRIESLTYAAELLAQTSSALQERDAPPIEHLLRMANDEIQSLASRISD